MIQLTTNKFLIKLYEYFGNRQEVGILNVMLLITFGCIGGVLGDNHTAKFLVFILASLFFPAHYLSYKLVQDLINENQLPKKEFSIKKILIILGVYIPLLCVAFYITS